MYGAVRIMALWCGGTYSGRAELGTEAANRTEAVQSLTIRQRFRRRTTLVTNQKLDSPMA